MGHGGDLVSYEGYFNGELIDFSSNINPLGPPKDLDQILINSFKDLKAYPDIKYRNLKESIANYLDCHKDNVLVGNGAVEIIDNFIILANRVLICIPSFSEYEKRALVHGKEIVKIPYNSDFSISIQSMANVLKERDLIILGNPNNPTGLRIRKDQLIKIYELIRNKEAYLLLDEAFFEFCPEDYDSIQIFKTMDYENVGIIRAATKFFSLPGIRLGYGCASVGKTKELEKVGLPWSVNSLANAAGIYIFNDMEYVEKSKAYIHREREWLLQKLLTIKGIKPYNTASNYILIQLLDWNEEYVFNFFLKRGIVIRRCSNFKGLFGEHIRIAIKDRKNNEKLIKIFGELSESI